jgi:hypothetical protein
MRCSSTRRRKECHYSKIHKAFPCVLPTYSFSRVTINDIRIYLGWILKERVPRDYLKDGGNHYFKYSGVVY